MADARPTSASDPVLRLHAVTYRYGLRADRFGLHDLHFQLRRGETCAVMGHNGSGKTTLLRLAAGLLRPQVGDVFVRSNGTEERVHRPRPEIGYIPQHLGLQRARTVEANVLLGALGRVRGWRSLMGLFPDEERERARQFIDVVGLRAKIHDKVHQLSGGERQRVAIARALTQRPTVLLADEFASNLDPVRQREILELVRSKLGVEHASTLMAIHNLDLARRFADRILFLRHGTIIFDLASSEVSPEVAERALTT